MTIVNHVYNIHILTVTGVQALSTVSQNSVRMHGEHTHTHFEKKRFLRLETSGTAQWQRLLEASSNELYACELLNLTQLTFAHLT